MTTTRENISGVIKVLDEYMIRSGKEEINEMEANRELAKAGLLADEQAHPGKTTQRMASQNARLQHPASEH